MTAKLTAPAPGDTVQITAVVLTSDTMPGGRHYGDSARLALKIEDGLDGYGFSNMFVTVDSEGRWFTKPAQEALAAVEAGEDLAGLKQRRDEKRQAAKSKSKKPTKTDDKPAGNVRTLDPTDISQMTVRQLRDYAQGNGIELPKGGKKAELLAQLKDAIADQPEANAA